MKESDIKKMSLAEIYRRMGVYAQNNELSIIMNTNDTEFLQKFIDNVGEADNLYQYIQQQIQGDEDKIDKLALIIVTLNNYIKNYNIILTSIRTSRGKTAEEIKSSEELFREFITEAKKILGDIKKTVYILKFVGPEECVLEILDSQELVTGKKKEENHKKLQELKAQGLDLEDVANAIVLTDLGNLICDPELGSLIRYQAFYNTGAAKGLIKEQNKTLIMPEEHINSLRKNMTYDEMVPNVVKALENSIEYIDVDKLLLCSAYRFIEVLESDVQLKEYEEVEIARRLRIIQNYLKGKNVKIQGIIEAQNFDSEEDEYEFVDISYRAKDLERDMQKYRGIKYFGKHRVNEIKTKLLSGEIQFRDLEYKEIQINTEEKISVALANDDNYLYLIENGLVEGKLIDKINTTRSTLSMECIRVLKEKQLLSEEEIIELYLQGKVNLETLSLLELDLKNKLKVEDVHFEFTKEDNEDRINRISELYKKMMAEEDEEHKEEIYNAYLSSLDARYLEIFLKLGTLSFEDLNGIMTASEWAQALEEKEISEEFFFELQQNGIIAVGDIKENKNALLNQLKLWEDGTIPSKYVEELGVSLDELLEMCDKGDITGKKIHELLHSEEERDSVRRKIKSSYTYGMFNTIRPGFVCYNNNLISRDNAISLAKQMRIREEEIVASCEQGFLSGEKIAEIYYGHLISKKAFLKMKELGLITEEEEINALNNLTPEEMISELEENGCEQVVDIEEIIRESTALKGLARRDGEGTFGYRKQVINPMARNKLLELLGADKIVTTPEQGFKGYQVYLIPKLNIAVMEKMFRLSKEKEVKPAYGDATYVCELGKFLMVAGQSKQEIRAFMEVEGSSNGRVEIIEHRKNWGSKLVEAVGKVNSAISIQKDKNKKVQQILKNGEEIGIDLQKLNELIERIRQGDYSLNLEDYE